MKSLKKQSGIVLFFALILLIVMTVIGVALAVNAGQSLRMAGAGSERIEAKAVADGGLAAVMNTYTPAELSTMAQLQERSFFGGKQTLTPLPILPAGAASSARNVPCQRVAPATGTDMATCRRIEVQNRVSYGRDDLGSITVTQGIEQELLKGSGS
ncbi:PilX N-terminal domain-containing pilus assembly protein [Shewanella sp. YIC-542]|uniref:pilus assembly PilX family protein n=1 Tax=Shewanella mytili TaxID=3377111 RepID=UPI00398E5575